MKLAEVQWQCVMRLRLLLWLLQSGFCSLASGDRESEKKLLIFSSCQGGHPLWG